MAMAGENIAAGQFFEERNGLWMRRVFGTLTNGPIHVAVADIRAGEELECVDGYLQVRRGGKVEIVAFREPYDVYVVGSSTNVHITQTDDRGITRRFAFDVALDQPAADEPIIVQSKESPQ